MADNIIVNVSGGGTKTLRAIDNTSVWLMAHAITDSGGTVVLKPVAEDASHSSADTGIVGMAVRQDTPGNLSGTDGDYEPLQVSAGRLWVSATVDAALPAGTNAIGKLAANSGVDIGDVDVTSIIPGTGATNLGKAIDGVTGGTDTGVILLATRDDALGGLTPAEGDNVQLFVSATGRLWCSATIDAALPAGTNAIGKLAANTGVDIGDVDVTSIVPGTGATNLGKAIDGVTGATDTGVLLLATRDDALAGITPAEGDNTQLFVDANGRLWGSVKVDSALPAGTNTIGNVKIAGLSATIVNGVSAAAVTSADASAADVDVTDAPSAGQKIVITDVVVSVAAAIDVTLKEETSGTVFAILYMAENQTVHLKFDSKQKLATADKKLVARTSGAGAVTVRASYYSEA